MDKNAELKARKWLAEQLAWEHRLNELRDAAGLPGVDRDTVTRDRWRLTRFAPLYESRCRSQSCMSRSARRAVVVPGNRLSNP